MQRNALIVFILRVQIDIHHCWILFIEDPIGFWKVTWIYDAWIFLDPGWTRIASAFWFSIFALSPPLIIFPRHHIIGLIVGVYALGHNARSLSRCWIAMLVVECLWFIFRNDGRFFWIAIVFWDQTVSFGHSHRPVQIHSIFQRSFACWASDAFSWPWPLRVFWRGMRDVHAIALVLILSFHQILAISWIHILTFQKGSIFIVRVLLEIGFLGGLPGSWSLSLLNDRILW